MYDQLMEWLHEQQRKLSKSNLVVARIGIKAYQDVLDKIYELNAAAKWDKLVLTEGKDKGEMRHFDNTNAPLSPPAPPAPVSQSDVDYEEDLIKLATKYLDENSKGNFILYKEIGNFIEYLQSCITKRKLDKEKK